MQADAVYRDPALVGTVDAYAHDAERLEGGQAVFPFQETADGGHPLGQRAEHDRPVGNGFVARNPQAAAEGAAGFDDESEIGHGWEVLSFKF